MKSLLNKILISALLLCSFNLLAKKPGSKLIDKLVGVINEHSISLSEVDRVLKSLKGRREISGALYNNVKTQKDVIKLLFQVHVVKKELDTLGYGVSDSRVDAQIQNTLKKIRLSKSQLIQQLAKTGLTFDEYYQVLKQSMEFSLFQQKIIAPLVIISEQEIRSLYLQKAGKKAAKTIQYKLSDFIIPKNKINGNDAKRLQQKIQSSLNSGNKVTFNNLEKFDVGNVKATSLSQQIMEHIQSANEGEVTSAIEIDDNYHYFYIEKKEFSQSDEFTKVKPQIANYLFEQKSVNISGSYFEKKIQEDYDTKFL